MVSSSVPSADVGVGAVGVDLSGLLGGDLVNEGLRVVGAEEGGEVDVGDAAKEQSKLRSSNERRE